MLKLKLQYFGHLMRRTDSLEKTLMLGKIEGRRRRDDRGWDGWVASLTRWTWVWVDSGSWWGTGRPGVLQSMESQSRTRLSNWTELNWISIVASSSSLVCKNVSFILLLSPSVELYILSIVLLSQKFSASSSFLFSISLLRLFAAASSVLIIACWVFYHAISLIR